MSPGMPERDRLLEALRTMAAPADVAAVDALIAERRAALTAAGDGDRPRLAYVLAVALNQRFVRTGDLADLRAAVSHLRTAVKCDEDDPFRARYVSELSAALSDLAHTHGQPDPGLADEAHRHVELGAFIAHPYDPITAQFKDAYASIRSARAAHRRRG